MKLAAKPSLLDGIRLLIQTSKDRVVRTVNSELVSLYWRIGQLINEDILLEDRAEYGKHIINSLSDSLTAEFGRGFNTTNLRYFSKFADMFPDQETVETLREQFSWTHFRILIHIEDDTKRQFYIEMCRIERWSTRKLEGHIEAMLFERTAISNKPEATVKATLEQTDQTPGLNPDLVFKSPYFLDFLGLADTYSEADLEAAIIAEMERFLIELGGHFAFVARQKQFVIDSTEYRIDLLFYHRQMRSLVAIDLKLGKFKAEHKGKMELYLRWLEQHETLEGENPPIGLILCSEQASEHLELLMLDQGNIRVAQYLTELPPKELLQQRFKTAIRSAQSRFKN